MRGRNFLPAFSDYVIIVLTLSTEVTWLERVGP